MYYSRFILYISIILSFESFNFGIHIILSIHSCVFCFLIGTTASQQYPCHSWSWRSTGWKFTNIINIVHIIIFIVFIVVIFFHHLDHCLNIYYSRFILYISIIFSFESFNLGIHIILSIHSGAFRFLIRTTMSGWCPCHSWSWRSRGWQFTNVINIVHAVVFVVFIVFMFFFIIWIIVLSMVI